MRRIITLLILLSVAVIYCPAQNSNVRRPTTTRTKPDKKTTSSAVKPHKRQVPQGTSYVNHHGLVAVDLGLSVKWASCNLGADDPWEYGNYYKWGETTPAEDKGWDAYNKGYTDGSNLKPTDDAATVNLGGKWRMPTRAEMDELISKCKQKWTTVKGINGIRVIGPNGNIIFFPASGERDYDGSLFAVGDRGYYWSATPLNMDIGRDNDHGCYLHFVSSDWTLSESHRVQGFPVRPVLAE